MTTSASKNNAQAPTKLAVYGVGNALVDMEYKIEDDFLASHDIAKGHMTLVEADRLQALTEALHGFAPSNSSGGSAANTIYAVQSFGEQAGYACKIAHDETGDYFMTAMRDAGVHVDASAQVEDGTTGRCLVLITPDAERSMNTHLGISATITTSALNTDVLKNSDCLYIEGYLCSGDDSTELAIAARETAEQAGITTTLTLSDPAMVQFCKDNLVKIIGNGVNHIFCNEEEALTWAGTDRLDIAVKELRDAAQGLSITLGAKGSMVVDANGQHEVAGFDTKVIDTNGAGDIYAGASLWGWTQGMDAKQAARFANYSAAQLVAAYGARMASPEAYRALESSYPRN